MEAEEKVAKGEGVVASRRMPLSCKRIAGAACYALWVLLLFYGVSLFHSAATVRGSLYISMIVALAALALSLPAVMLVGERFEGSARRVAVVSCAVVMSIGSIMDSFADASTTNGMLLLGVGSILAGVGSSGLFAGWFKVLEPVGSRVTLAELSLAGAAAFLAGFLLFGMGSAVSIVAVIALPVASALFLSGLLLDSSDSPDAAPQLKRLVDVSWSTKLLFAKIALGSFLVGFIQGFFDLLLGYETYAVYDVYGLYLFVMGLLVMMAVCIAVCLTSRQCVFGVYRVSMFLICLGCLLMPFIGDGTTYYSGAIVFAGYVSFGVVLCVLCVEAASSFLLSCASTAAIVLSALFLGQVLGMGIALAFDEAAMAIGLPSIVLIAVSVLFVLHGFVLTELDLVRIGLGEIGDSGVGDGSSDSGSGASCGTEEDVCSGISERFGLTPRESEVLPLLLQGRTISRIQETLFISAGTVSTHIRHIYQKTGVSNRQELMDMVERDYASQGQLGAFFGKGPEE